MAASVSAVERALIPAICRVFMVASSWDLPWLGFESRGSPRVGSGRGAGRRQNDSMGAGVCQWPEWAGGLGPCKDSADMV